MLSSEYSINNEDSPIEIVDRRPLEVSPDLLAYIEEVLPALNAKPFTSAVVYYNGKFHGEIPASKVDEYENNGFTVLPRSLAAMFLMLCLDQSQTDITKVLKVSKSFISHKSKELRDIPQVRAILPG
jgi:hypothetical protein